MSLIKEYYVGKTEKLDFSEDSVCPYNRPAWIHLPNGEKENIKLLKVQTDAGRFFYLSFFGGFYLPENSRKEEISLYYDKAAETYEKNMRSHSQIGNFLLKQLKASNIRMSSILSIGAGTGIELENFAKKYPKITLLDVSSQMLKIAKRKKIFHESTFITSDFLDYNFRNKKYDMVICCLAIHYFSGKDLDEFIKKVFSILDDNGHFILVNINIPQQNIEKYFSLEKIEKFKITDTDQQDTDLIYCLYEKRRDL